MKNRKAKIKARQTTTYVVEMFEDGVLVETRPLLGKSIRYAEDCAANWENGIIPSPSADDDYDAMARSISESHPAFRSDHI
tara:strand:+ start:5220 stop:5462 length:243 start_codon:yes stop_codon:yes gene_type:complete